MKKKSLDQFIDEIENALFDQDEPGCQDNQYGDLLVNSIGRIRLRDILKEIRKEK